MNRASRASPETESPDVAAGRLQWKAPRLVRMGTVQALTSKKDNVGKNDGGSGGMKRT